MGSFETTVPRKDRYIKMKIVLLFYFMIPGRSMYDLNDVFGVDEPAADSDGVPLTRTSGIVGTTIFYQGEAECKCSSFSRGLRGNCQSKYKGYYWCYLEKNKIKETKGLLVLVSLLQ